MNPFSMGRPIEASAMMRKSAAYFGTTLAIPP